MFTTAELPKRAVIVSVLLHGEDEDEHRSNQAELRRLLYTLGVEVVGAVEARRRGLVASTLIGSGKLKEIARYTGGTGVVPSGATPPKTKARAKQAAAKAAAGEAEPFDDDDSDDADADADASAEGGADAGADADADADADPAKADLVVIDREITPRQARHIEQATDADVLDRSGVIVEIFHRHARTREARLQVEIARLTYVVPRLRAGAGGHDRGRGSGPGGKGPGESALELDRRKVGDRIAELRRELDAIEREQQGRRAQRNAERRVALVGYTNAGKSSLMRALTGSEVLVADKLFATLGTTVRSLAPPAHPTVLVSDTVGFIRNLPHDLVASFRSTLAEALDAALLLVVVDSSDPTFRSQLQVTTEVLDEIGAGELPRLLLLNKIDRVDAAGRQALAAEHPQGVLLSAHAAADVTDLRQRIIAFFERDLAEVELFVPYSRGEVVGRIREETRVVTERYDEQGSHFVVRAPARAIERVRALLAAPR